MMRTAITSEPAPGHANEDFAGATSRIAVVLDGAGLSDVDDGGCKHGVAWYTHQLGEAIFVRANANESTDLQTILAEGIADVADSHRASCDLTHPGTPSTTVVIVRENTDGIDYLVLADSVLVIECSDEHLVICDDREAQIGTRYRKVMDELPGGTQEHGLARRDYVATLRAYRNQPNGFWVAAADPAAAKEAVNGVVPFGRLRTATLLSDGASRLVDRFRLADWSKVTTMLKAFGPKCIIDAVRKAEMADPTGSRWPRGKIHDDATIVYCDRFQQSDSTHA
jgi:hypothetical protein